MASSYLLLPLPLEADREATFYLHFVGDTSRYGEARVGRRDHPTTGCQPGARRDVLFGQGIYGGIILGLVLYNLILYGAIAERAYLYYSLYVLTFGSVWIARTGFFFQYLWPQSPRNRVGVRRFTSLHCPSSSAALCAPVPGDSRPVEVGGPHPAGDRVLHRGAVCAEDLRGRAKHRRCCWRLTAW